MECHVVEGIPHVKDRQMILNFPKFPVFFNVFLGVVS